MMNATSTSKNNMTRGQSESVAQKANTSHRNEVDNRMRALIEENRQDKILLQNYNNASTVSQNQYRNYEMTHKQAMVQHEAY